MAIIKKNEPSLTAIELYDSLYNTPSEQKKRYLPQHIKSFFVRTSGGVAVLLAATYREQARFLTAD